MTTKIRPPLELPDVRTSVSDALAGTLRELFKETGLTDRLGALRDIDAAADAVASDAALGRRVREVLRELAAREVARGVAEHQRTRLVVVAGRDA